MKKLRIKNFQIHKDLEIEFGPITTIVGPSDIGKSAVLRALNNQ
jgi:AAA15 family ATPase/GTPase